MTTGAEAAERLALCGTQEPEPRVRLLQAGPLTAEFVAGNLREIRFDRIEAIRAIGYIVRDKDLGTYALEISNLRVTEDGNGFQLLYDARCHVPDGSMLFLSASILGRSKGLLRLAVHATPICIRSSASPVRRSSSSASTARGRWPLCPISSNPGNPSSRCAPSRICRARA